MRDSHRLLLIVLTATTARVFTLWVGRAEFVGWFNHSYYYFVEVRGLLEKGSLPYPDMPLLFHLYALVARALIALGVETGAAIVASTRAVMSLVPSLIPVPIYGVIRDMNGGESIRRVQWMLILLSGFLPLSLSHLPEFMQKNVLGLLLLSVLIYCSQRLLRSFSVRAAVVAGLVALLIVLAHFGTTAATVLWAIAVVASLAIVRRTLRGAPLGAGLIAVGGVAAVALIYALDVQRFRRLVVYLGDSVQSSLLGALFDADSRRAGSLASLAAVFGLYVFFFLLYRLYSRHGAGLPAGDRAFWLANILVCGLLVLPVLDERLMARLALFSTVPLLILFAHVEAHAVRRPWVRAVSLAVATALVVLMAAGELVSSRIRNTNHAAVLADIEAVRDRQLLTPDDLVITKTGAEHICNWFYGVKAGVITALELEDFIRYERVFVLNPIEGGLDLAGLHGRVADSEADKYFFMLRSIPRPADIEPIFLSQHIELFELKRPPAEWIFAEDGSWWGYGGSHLPESAGVMPR